MAVKEAKESIIKVPEHPLSIPPSVLLLILDLHPLSWSLLSQPPPPDADPGQGSSSKVAYAALHLDHFITVLMVFLNAVLASSGGNQVVVYGATSGRSKMLYPPSLDYNDGEEGSSSRSNSYEPFRMLDTRIERGLRSMAEEEQHRISDTNAEGVNDPPAIVSALTKALCHINRLSPPSTHSSSLTATDSSLSQLPQDRIEPRILIINATPGSQGSTASASGNGNGNENEASGGGRMRGGYVGLMNCVFAAQKAKVPIDVLSLPPPYTNTSPPIFLQQASHLTEGVYWRWNGKGALLEYLHTIYLPPPSLRRTAFSVPPQDAVDYRAVCFCHGDVVDIGFVCSVCLSIFCKPIPVCQMCKTRFPIKSLPTLRALGENLTPVPIPDIIVPPTVKPHEFRPKKGASTNGTGGAGGTRAEPMEID